MCDNFSFASKFDYLIELHHKLEKLNKAKSISKAWIERN